MSRSQKSNTLYSHPFSKAYWRDAAAELKDTHMLVFAALMIALRLVMKQLAIPITPFLKINTAFFINALGAMVFGPVMAMLAACITDVLGYVIRPEGMYFLPFILTEVGGALVFALFLYRAKVTTTRVMLSRFTVSLVINVLLQTPIMMWYYALYMDGKQYTLAMVVPGMIKNIFMFPIESVLLALFLGVMLPITNRLGLTYSVGHSKEALKFNKKQIVTLAVLFALGCGCVAGYLGYYYENNSLTKNYSAEEVVEKNQEMYDIISGRTRENKPCVAIIEYAKKPFLSKEVTYTVAYYAITPADGSAAENFDQTQLWSLKKTPAAKNENLTRLGTAVIVCNDSSGEVLQYTYTPALDHPKTSKGHAKACPFFASAARNLHVLQESCQTAYSQAAFFGILHKNCKKVCIL